MDEPNTDAIPIEVTKDESSPPVMDIKPTSPVPTTPAEPLVSELATPPEEVPVQTESAAETAGPIPDNEPSTTTPASEHQAASVPDKPAKRKPVLLITIAIVVALILALAAIFAYINKNKSKTANSTATTAAAATSAAAAAQTTQKATSSDVSQASKDVDTSLSKADGSNDISSNDLTDTSLGLQ